MSLTLACIVGDGRPRTVAPTICVPVGANVPVRPSPRPPHKSFKLMTVGLYVRPFCPNQRGAVKSSLPVDRRIICVNIHKKTRYIHQPNNRRNSRNTKTRQKRRRQRLGKGHFREVGAVKL